MGTAASVMIWFAKNNDHASAAVRVPIVQHVDAGLEACCLDLLHLLVPHLKGVLVESVKDLREEVMITTRTAADQACCTGCGAASARVHSRHKRRLQDGSVGGRPLVIKLVVRRFFCRGPGCTVDTFTEQADGLSTAYRRRSVPLLGMLEQVGLALAGRAGARLPSRLGIPVHPATLVRMVRAMPDPELTRSPRVLGDETFVDFPSGTAGRAHSDAAFAAAGLRREVAFEVTAAHLMARLIQHGLAIGMLPAAFMPELPDLTTVQLHNAPARPA